MKLHSSLTGDFLLKCPVNSSENGEYKPDFNKGNYLDFDYDLAKSLYKFNPYDTNASYNHLIDSYHLAMKKWVPFRRHSTTKKNKQHKWFNSEIKRATVLQAPMQVPSITKETSKLKLDTKKHEKQSSY